MSAIRYRSIFTGRPPEEKAAAKFQLMQILGDIEFCVSAESFADDFYVMRKDNASEDVQRAFPRSTEFLKVCSVYDEVEF